MNNRWDDYCIAHYRCYDKRIDFHKKAHAIAMGMTVGTWTELSATRQKTMEKHLGQVVDVTVYEPSAHEDSPTQRHADIAIAYPQINFSTDIPALLVTVFGKVSMDGKLKLIDLTLPPSFSKQFSGAKFGIAGIREKLGIPDRPLLMSIFKSVIGYDLHELREQFTLQALGGVDLIKDDEILFENPLTPLERRIKVCHSAAQEVFEQTGQTVLYAANLTGKTSALATHARQAIASGASALLFNVFVYGYDALHELAADRSIHVPIVAHPSFAGAMYPSPHYGVSASLLMGKLLRLAGADLVLFPSPYGSVTMPVAHTQRIADALRDQTNTHQKPVFPVPSAGIHPGIVPKLYADFGNDTVINAGGGIHGHRSGTVAGGRAFRHAITAATQGIPLDAYAAQLSDDALRHALEQWGTL